MNGLFWTQFHFFPNNSGRTKIEFKQHFQQSPSFLCVQPTTIAEALGISSGSRLCSHTPPAFALWNQPPSPPLLQQAAVAQPEPGLLQPAPACALATSSPWAISPARVHRDKGMRDSWRLQRALEPVPAASKCFLDERLSTGYLLLGMPTPSPRWLSGRRGTQGN